MGDVATSQVWYTSVKRFGGAAMEETKQILTAILGRLDEMGADIHSIKGDILGMKADIAELKSDVAVLKSDVAELKSDVAVLKSDVAELKSDVAVLKSDVAVLKSDVAEIKETQTRHERILELLSIKSIDHEASIRDIRKTQEN